LALVGRIACVIAVIVALAAGARAEQRWAIVIGSNPGWSQDRPLRYAEQDAERVRDVLVSLGGFAPDRVQLMRDPSTADVRAALRKLARTAHDSNDEDTLVFVYYSGHADDRHLHLRGEPMSHQELQDTLRSLPATIKLAVIDACKSGAVTQKGAAQVDEFEVSLVNPKLSGLAILTSSGADELSQESRALQGSVFTHHLVSGLRGAADDDGDAQVTIAEAYHYAYARTQADTATSGAPQRPAFRYELHGQGEIVMTRLAAKGSVAAIVPRGAAQKYVIVDAHELRLIAEATADTARDVVLALAPGTYHVKRVLDDRLEVGELVVAAGDRADVGKLRYTSAPLSAGILKGGAGDLTPAERRELARVQAFTLLDDDQAPAALAVFDALLREQPADPQAWRGRGRALVRMAEAFQRVGDHASERRALADALTADPSLGEDPMFTIWYQRLGELDARARTTFETKQRLEEEVRINPRTVKRFGFGFDLFSGRGTFAVTGTVVVHRMFFPTVAVDLAGPGLDLGTSFAPFPSRWSPYLGLGGHVSLKKLGLDIGGGGGMVSVNADSYSYDEMWGTHARVEGGAQYVGGSGFTAELGLAMILFRTDEGKSVQQLWPVIHLGWLF
jgi:hypothetical protein